MSQRASGNGSGKVNVHTQDMGGWVRVFTDEPALAPADLPVLLSLTLTEWFRKRPQLRPYQIVPIMQGGDTVELHAWYELHVFPDISGNQPVETPHP